MWHKYFAIAQVQFQKYMTYRGDLFIEILGMLFTTFLAIGLWYALFQASGETEIRGYTMAEMITYLLGTGFVIAVFHLNQQGDEQMWDINSGTLNTYLLKPLSPVAYWLVSDIARKVMMFFFVFIVSVIVGLFFWDYLVFPSSWLTFVFFFLSCICAAFVHFFFFHLITLATFWLGVSWGLSLIFRVLMTISTGALIPLELFSDGWREFFLFLPFKFFGYVQTQIFLEHFSTQEILWSFVELFAWGVGIALVSRFVYMRGLKTYGAYGG